MDQQTINRHVEEACKASAALLLARLTSIKDRPEMASEIFQEMFRGSMAISLGSLMPIPMPLLALASGSPNGVDGGFHFILYAHVEEKPEALLDEVTELIRPHLKGVENGGIPAWEVYDEVCTCGNCGTGAQA